MLLKSAILLTTSASHFRSGSFQFSQKDENQLVLSRTLNYRRGFSGYEPACQKSHVRKGKQSATMEYEHSIITSTNTTVSIQNATYVVTDIENQGYLNSQWCYGTIDEPIPKPAEPFEYYFQNCCWVDLKDDHGEIIADGPFKLYARYYDTENNSPQVKVPPIWRVMTGCPNQALALNPEDKDGDRIRCRWSSEAEAKSAYYFKGNYTSLSLDEETCVLNYDGTIDTVTSGVKPIAIQVEDYDENGNIKSSIPVQFLASVWEPEFTGNMLDITGRFLYDYEEDDVSEAFFWGDVFVGHDNHEHVRKRREALINEETGLPYYCDEPPQLIFPSPEAGVQINVTGTVKIDVRAFYYQDLEPKYDLSRFQFNSPQGMECTDLDQTNGRASCIWTPTQEQREQRLHGFCFLAIDKLGRQTERRCVSLKIEDFIDDVFSMLNLNAPEFGSRALTDYGCAGRNLLDPFHSNIGAPVDLTDKALSRWKTCIRCAKDVELTSIYEVGELELPKYFFNVDTQSCENYIGTLERSICECDKKLADTLKNFRITRKYQNYKDTKCLRRGASDLAEDPRCCGDHDGFFKMYFASKNCCEEDGQIRTIGECFEDVGIPYTAKITIYRPEYVQTDDEDGKDNTSSTSSDSGSSDEDNNSSDGNGGSSGGSGNSKPNKWDEETNDLEGNL